MSNTQKEYDPRFSKTPPFKSGDAVYLKSGEIFHVVAVTWSLEHKQWSVDLTDADDGKSMPKRSVMGLMTKREFFSRGV